MDSPGTTRARIGALDGVATARSSEPHVDRGSRRLRDGDPTVGCLPDEPIGLLISRLSHETGTANPCGSLPSGNGGSDMGAWRQLSASDVIGLAFPFMAGTHD